MGLGDHRTLENLVRHVQNLECMDTGIFGTDIVPRILFENGYADLAMRFLTFTKQPSFGYMCQSGATTLWEEWLKPRSMSHPMFGAAVRYLFTYVLGIRQTADSCGFRKIVIEPADMTSLRYASGSLTSARGRIDVTVDRNAGTLTVTVPDGIEASCRLSKRHIPLQAGTNVVTLREAADTICT